VDRLSLKPIFGLAWLHVTAASKSAGQQSLPQPPRQFEAAHQPAFMVRALQTLQPSSIITTTTTDSIIATTSS
jgi:hypothetical protein